MNNSAGNSTLPPNLPGNRQMGNNTPGGISRSSIPSLPPTPMGYGGMQGQQGGMGMRGPNPTPVPPPPEPEKLSSDPEVEDGGSGQLPVGMRIDDRYEILGVLGTGGFATVYRAHHLTIDRDVALKVMDMKKGVDPSYSERFFREAKIAAKIHHNNVVSVYDFGHVAETGQPYCHGDAPWT